MGIIANFVSRITGSGLPVNHYQEYRMHRQLHYWQTNSIYLENIYNKIATDVAMMKFKHIHVVDDGTGQPKATSLVTSPLLQVLSVSPNDLDAPMVFWSKVIRKLIEEGTAVVVPTYRGANISSIQLADGSSYYDGSDQIAVQVNGSTQKLSISDVWIFENPKQNLSVQLSNISQLIDDNLHSISMKLNDGQSLKGFIKFPTKAASEQLSQHLEKRKDDIFNAAKNGGIGFLEQGEEFQELKNTYATVTSDELTFLKQQLYNSFGINEDLFTANYTEDQYRAYFQSVVKVYTRVVQEEINRKALTPTARTQGQKVLTYIDLFDVSSLKDLNSFAYQQAYLGTISPNEARSIFGFGSYDGGDVYMTNKNAIPVSQLNGTSQPDPGQQAPTPEANDQMSNQSNNNKDQYGFAVGDVITINADHMPGMKGAIGKIDPTPADTPTGCYMVDYQPTDGGDIVRNHKWVAANEIELAPAGTTFDDDGSSGGMDM